MLRKSRIVYVSGAPSRTDRNVETQAGQQQQQRDEQLQRYLGEETQDVSDAGPPPLVLFEPETQQSPTGIPSCKYSNADIKEKQQSEDPIIETSLWSRMKSWLSWTKSHKEMCLPEDREKKIVWDEQLQRYVGDGIEEDPDAGLPPLVFSESASMQSPAGIPSRRYRNAFDNPI